MCLLFFNIFQNIAIGTFLKEEVNVNRNYNENQNRKLKVFESLKN